MVDCTGVENRQGLAALVSSKFLPPTLVLPVTTVTTMPRKHVRELAGTLQIPYLVHFTRAVNLRSIVEHGLYPRSRVDEVDAEPVLNDQLRLDGRTDGTSVSIAFPNNSMFYRYRMEDETVPWVVLALHPAILWEKDCAFCMHNAADARISCQDLDRLKTTEALAGMYGEIEGVASRKEQRLKGYDPTDVQAEVLVFDVIEPKYVVGAVFATEAIKNEYSAPLGGRQILVHGPKRGMFGSRSYSRMFK